MSSAYTIDDLINAARQGNIEQVRACLGARINPNLMNESGRTPLHWAANSTVVEALLAAGANPNLMSKCGDTPLYLAANSTVVKALLADERTDPRLRDNEGRTAAQLARERGHIGIAEAIEAKITEKNEEDRRWSPFRAAFVGAAARAQANRNGLVFGVPSREMEAGAPAGGASATVFAGGGSAGAADATKPSSTPFGHFGMD